MMNRTIRIALLLLCALLLQACAEENPPDSVRPAESENIPILYSRDQLSRVISEAGDRLLLLDFFADWCLPCRELEPILGEIARKAKDRIDVYRIDLEGNQALAQGFQVQGIPYVVFVKNQVIVYKLMGLHPKETYWEVIRSFSADAGS